MKCLNMRVIVYVFYICTLSSTLKYLQAKDNDNLKSQQTEWSIKWTENWGVHDEDLDLVYSDHHVAFYYDLDMDKNITWPFQLVSSAWKYSKEAYGSLIQDPLLYIVLHKRENICFSSPNSPKKDSFFKIDKHFRNVIDCGQSERHTWEIESEAIVELMGEFGEMLQALVRKGGNWPLRYDTRWPMGGILVYDILLKIGKSTEAQRWKESVETFPVHVPRPDTLWFKDWFLPIYTNYGVEALGKFFLVACSNWPHIENDEAETYDVGALVHFWSEAAGENLWQLAASAFGWGAWIHKKYIKARRDYPNVTYTDSYLNSTIVIPPEKWTEHWENHNDELTLVYVDGNVAIYFDPQMDFQITWPYKMLSDSWAYVKKTYGPVGSYQLLYVIFHDGKFDGCIISRQDSYIDARFENKTVIDCSRLSDTWAAPYKFAIIMRYIGHLIQAQVKQIGNWPAYQLSRWDMETILGYDIYLGIGMEEEAITWLQYRIDSKSRVTPVTKFWVRDWYYPIYAKYGRHKVLNSFFNLLSLHWPKDETGLDYAGALNVGEFVHFWSGAAGVNLKYLAKKSFGWNENYESEYNNAITNYSQIVYKDIKNEDIENDDSAPTFLDEEDFGHSERLSKAYSDKEIDIYFDIYVNPWITWPFDFLSKMWHITKATFTFLNISEKLKLSVFLHSKKYHGCKLLWEADTDADKENNQKIIIDCGIDSKEAWVKESAENKDVFVNEYMNIVQLSATHSEGLEAYDRAPFTNILAFDTYLRLGMIEDAYRILKVANTKYEISSGVEMSWIRDWYIPIYEAFGGVSVLNTYLSLLARYWIPSRIGKNKKLNIGQMVHFWSAAAGINLFDSAEYTFGWNELHKEVDQFIDARMEFSNLDYFCYSCHLQRKLNEESSLIVGLSVGFTCVVIATILIPLLIYKRKLHSLKKQIRELTTEEVQTFFEGNPNEVSTDGNANIESRPFNKDYEIPRELLEVSLDAVLGSGEFGLVLRGVIKAHGDKFLEDQEVAVKTVKPNVDVTYFKALLTELKVMGFLGSHANIASLLGAFTVNIRNRQVYVALEFCAKGDLLGYIKNNRSKFKDLFGNKTLGNEITPEPRSITMEIDMERYIAVETYESGIQRKELNEAVVFSTTDLLDWAIQVSQGMAYIASKKVIHGDLAARNILLTGDNIAKISDFGLSRQLVNYSNYMKTSKTPVPWRWMAIESLRDMNFSVQSDVWAFGVTLYEIFSLGTTPYAGWTWDYEFIDKLVAGHRLNLPECGNDKIYHLMMDCMKLEPNERTTFKNCNSKLKEVKTGLCFNEFKIENCNYAKLDSISEN